MLWAQTGAELEQVAQDGHWLETIGAEWGIGGSVLLVVVGVGAKLLRAYGRHETQHQETKDELKAVKDADDQMCKEMSELRHAVERVADKVGDTNERVSRIEGRMNGHYHSTPLPPGQDFQGHQSSWT